MHHLKGVTVSRSKGKIILVIPEPAIEQAAKYEPFDISENDYTITDRAVLIEAVADGMLTYVEDDHGEESLQGLRTFVRNVLEWAAVQRRGIEIA